jgi:hypothetical protein
MIFFLFGWSSRAINPAGDFVSKEITQPDFATTHLHVTHLNPAANKNKRNAMCARWSGACRALPPFGVPPSGGSGHSPPFAA